MLQGHSGHRQHLHCVVHAGNRAGRCGSAAGLGLIGFFQRLQEARSLCSSLSQLHILLTSKHCRCCGTDKHGRQEEHADGGESLLVPDSTNIRGTQGGRWLLCQYPRFSLCARSLCGRGILLFCVLMVAVLFVAVVMVVMTLMKIVVDVDGSSLNFRYRLKGKNRATQDSK